MPPADNLPDLDNMSPEEIMRWMETLAVRQGATEGIITSADSTIADVDANAAPLNEPGYVPSEGSAKPAPAAKPPTPRPEDVPAPQPVAVTPPPPAPQPVAVTPPPAPDPVPQSQPAVAADDGLGWLSGLAAGFGDDSFAGLEDLEALAADLDVPSSVAGGSTDTLSWLEGLVGGGDDNPLAATSSQAAQPPAAPSTRPAEDPMAWLDDMADTPLIPGVADVTPRTAPPAPSAEQDDASDDDESVWEDFDDALGGPVYEALDDLALDLDDVPTLEREPRVDGDEATDPLDDAAQPHQDWLKSFAGSARTGVPVLDEADDVLDAEDTSLLLLPDDDDDETLQFGDDDDDADLPFAMDGNEGAADVPPWLLTLTGADDTPDTADETPLAQAEIPAWLLEMQPQPPSTPGEPALIDEIFEPRAEAVDVDLPEWLRSDVVGEDDLSNIFAAEEADDAALVAEVDALPTEEATPLYIPIVDTSDAWAQAFEEEMAWRDDPAAVPAWYEDALSDPTREPNAPGLGVIVEPLTEADLPDEESVPRGQDEAIPAWLIGAAPSVMPPAAAQPAAEEQPSWLSEPVAAPTPEPTQVIEEPLAVTAAALAPAAALDVPATLYAAQTSAAQGDLETALVGYERVVRANAALDQVATALQTLATRERGNPAVLRVLGDALMRQGKLQAALDAYRRALNLL